MEFDHQIHVPSDIDTTFKTLTDLEAVAACLPGATLEKVEGNTYTGLLKVKIGPIQVTYRGTAELTDVDSDGRHARIGASGREVRGSGTARADVTATLSEDADGTSVELHTDLQVTGKPAQFGRGVLADVGDKTIASLAEQLREHLGADLEPAPHEQGTAAATAAAAPGQPTAATAPEQPTAAAGPESPLAHPQSEDDPLDLAGFAGAATARRALPLAGAVAALLVLLWWWRSR